MSELDRQRELYTKMVAAHRDMRECVRLYEEWQSDRDIDDLTAACLEFGRIALKFGGEIME